MKKSKKIKSYYFGLVAEFIVVIFLFFKGYKILARRYKTFVGEIDIVARKGGDLIAIEVKARRINATPDVVLSKNQQKRIKRAIVVFISKNQKRLGDFGVRFDLIIVNPFKMPQHLRGFWE